MKLIADLHTHTCASTHAFSTMGEMIAQAKILGLKAIAITDHAPDMPDSPHKWYFDGLVKLPGVLPDGFLLLKGVEADAMDITGTLDMDKALLQKMDWVIVSLHGACISPLRYEEATDLWLHIAENPYVDMIGHSEQQQYYYDYDRVTKAFTANNKVVEINANSPIARPGNEANMRELALCCLRNGTQIAVNSDAHSIYNMSNAQNVMPLLEEIGFPEAQIVNASMKNLAAALNAHGRPIASEVEKLAL